MFHIIAYYSDADGTPASTESESVTVQHVGPWMSNRTALAVSNGQTVAFEVIVD